MNLINVAGHTTAEATLSVDADGRQHLLVVFKATYRIPENGRPARPLLPPAPLAFSDDFVGEPGLSALWSENDFAAVKEQCDVLFKAQAHSPDGRPVTRLDVAVRVGDLQKAISVVGDRVWEKDLFILRHSRPQAFVAMPLDYGRAFGGSPVYEDDGPPDPYPLNPFGQGYSRKPEAAGLHGRRLPNLEKPGRPVRRPDGSYHPEALSALPRTAPPRRDYAGTYDQNWRDNIAPFLPPDFDPRFFQSAPPDQQITPPIGGEPVSLINLMPGRPEVHFELPRLDTVPVRVLKRDLSVAEPAVRADTLFFEPDEGRFSVTWRTRCPLSFRGLREVKTVVIGQICSKWWEAVRRGAGGCQGCAERVSFDKKPDHCPETPEEPAEGGGLMPEVSYDGRDAEDQS